MKSKLFLLAFLISATCTFSQKNKRKPDTVRKTITKDTATVTFKDSFRIIPTEQTETIKVFVKDEPTISNWFKDILPVLTLIIGIMINRGIDFTSNRKRTKKHGDRWIAELNAIKDPIATQIEYLSVFKKEHDKEVFGIPKLNVVSILDGESFSSLDKAELIKYLEIFKKKKFNQAITLSNRVNIFVSILKNHLKNLQNKFEEYLNGTSLQTTNLSKHLQDFLARFALYGVIIEKELGGGDPLGDPRYKPVFDLVNSEIYPYMAKGDYDIYKLEKNFIEPLFEFFALHRFDERIFPLAESIRGCIVCIKGIKMEKHYLSENLGTIIERYAEEQSQLEEILNDFETKNNKKTSLK